MVGGPQSFHQVENRFSRSLETIHRKFNMVLNCLYNLGKDNIKPVDRNFTDVHPRIQDPRFWPHFKGAIGAIDGSHIPVEVPKEEEINHTGRHGYTSQNLLAICDFDLRFTFVVAGWPGSAHDTRRPGPEGGERGGRPGPESQRGPNSQLSQAYAVAEHRRLMCGGAIRADGSFFPR
jgi:hypothetical protein